VLIGVYNVDVGAIFFLNIERYEFFLQYIVIRQEAMLQQPYQIRHMTYSIITGRQFNGLGGV